MRLVECVPNFSEGRNIEIIDKIVNEMISVPGVYLLDRESDKDHNRSVITIVGTPEAVAEAAFRGTKKAMELIDLNKHQGEHPRIGATDVIPFIPISNVSMEECIELAKKLAKRISDELKIPTYLYEEAATREDRRNLANIRKGQFEGLKEAIKTDPDRAPDFGPRELHPTAGATVVGARYPLIAFNVYLGTNDIEIAKQIARNVRYSSGGLRYVKAMGFEIKERNLVQVSMNMVNYKGTPLYRVFELIRAEARRYGVSIVEGEIVGLVPQEALYDTSEFYLQLNNFSKDQILEVRLQKVLEENKQKLVSQEIGEFLENLSSDAPVPGGGSAAALTAAMGASLGSMVLRITLKKEELKDVHNDANKLLMKIEGARKRLIELIDEDSNAFNSVMKAFRLPKTTDEEKEKRKQEIQNAFKYASQVPLETAKTALIVLKEMEHIAKIGYVDAISDCGSGVKMLEAGIESALLNVKINLNYIKDEEFVTNMKKEIQEIEKETKEYSIKIFNTVLSKIEGQ